MSNMDAFVESRKAELREHSRYPYTFACDRIRSAGLAESRANASQWYQKYADKMGIDADVAATRFAEEYINHEAILDFAEDIRAKSMASLRESLQTQDQSDKGGMSA